MRTQRQRARIPQPAVRERLIGKGCEPKFLDELLALWCRLSKPDRREEEQARSTQKILKALRGRVTKFASRIEQVKAKPLDILSGKSLAQVRPRRSFLDSEAGSLKDDASKIERSMIRRDTRPLLIKTIAAYCRERCGKVTNREVADLLEEATDHHITVSEEAVRKAVDRQTLSDNEDWARVHNLVGAAMRGDLTRRKPRSSDANKT
jgi:hypothetical protein